MNVEDLFAEEKEGLPEEWHETFDKLVGKGSSPSGVLAAIEYVTTPKTQDEITSEFNTSQPTIRNLYPAVLAIGPKDDLESKTGPSGMTVDEMIEVIAEANDWTEGKHYSITENTYGQSDSVNMLKQGWKSLYSEAIDE